MISSNFCSFQTMSCLIFGFPNNGLSNFWVSKQWFQNLIWPVHGLVGDCLDVRRSGLAWLRLCWWRVSKADVLLLTGHHQACHAQSNPFSSDFWYENFQKTSGYIYVISRQVFCYSLSITRHATPPSQSFAGIDVNPMAWIAEHFFVHLAKVNITF